jgi:RNA polymerase sigma-70 factor (ECF subfamily)
VDVTRKAVEHSDDRQWIVRAREGDRTAFTILVDRYWGRIYRWLFALGHHAQLAEDLTQDVFLKAWLALPEFEGDGFRAWLFRIAANAFRDSQRGPRGLAPQPLPESASTAEQGPVATALEKECRALVEQACARLPEHFRAVLLLRTQEDLSFAEIAAIVGATEETVRWRLFRARQLLLRELGPYLDKKNP